MKEKLERIFGLKVSFNHKSESQEQECIFVEVESTKNNVSAGRFKGKAMGKLRFFVNSDKLPFGFFSQKISLADRADIDDFFFYDFEENTGTILNICERLLSFIYLYDMEYNPSVGLINELETTVTAES